MTASQDWHAITTDKASCEDELVTSLARVRRARRVPSIAVGVVAIIVTAATAETIDVTGLWSVFTVSLIYAVLLYILFFGAAVAFCVGRYCVRALRRGNWL